MKMPRLGEVELARNAPLVPEHQRKNLERAIGGNARVWYSPVRNLYPDIFNIGSGLLGPAVPTSWSKIEQSLLGRCGAGPLLKHNSAVAKALHEYCIREKISGQAHEFGPMYMGSAAGYVSYWLPMTLVINGKITVVFIDPRRPVSQLTADGRRFVLSMMHEHIRKTDPDFANVQLAVIQFSDGGDIAGAPILHTDKGATLYSYSELQDMVDVTYKLWGQLHAERRSASLLATSP